MTSSVNTQSLTQEKLREVLDYNPDTGIFTWRVRPHKRSRKQIGDAAGSVKTVRGHEYIYIGIDYVQYHATHLAWLYVNGCWPKRRITFLNDKTTDLRISNLVEMRTTPNRHDFTTAQGYGSYRREYREANRDHLRNQQFKKYYGIDMDRYQKMLMEQNGVCAICGKPETTVIEGKIKWLSVDHCHETKAVRALLCHNCNHGLGHFFDNSTALRLAADYLDKHAASNVVPLTKKDTG